MSGLDSIGVTVESARETAENAHNAVPVLNEIRHALTKLATTGETTTIDLSSIPFGAEDRQQLLDVLGRGEVDATIDAMGPTLVRETAFPGVWLVEYFDADEREIGTHIQITRLPALLATPEDDVAESAASLAARLARDDPFHEL